VGTLSPIRRAPTTSAGRVVGVIPARLASTRLPRKVLRNLLGEPLLAWVYRAAIACPELDEVIIAADSDEVALQLCTQRGWPCILTSPDLPSGTDRLYRRLAARSPPKHLRQHPGRRTPAPPAAHRRHPRALRAAARRRDHSQSPLHARQHQPIPNAVKVVTAADGRALYFSRATIPYTTAMLTGNARSTGSTSASTPTAAPPSNASPPSLPANSSKPNVSNSYACSKTASALYVAETPARHHRRRHRRRPRFASKRSSKTDLKSEPTPPPFFPQRPQQ
jgi:CMP-2-keto-3-deoxyoctulosonic acid synthetase